MTWESTSLVWACFFAQGKPVKNDDLAEQYSNRPYAQVFEAVGAMNLRLQPLWDAVPEPFPMEKAKTRNGGANISVSTIEAIKALSAQGMKPEEIAKKLNVSTWTVYRSRK